MKYPAFGTALYMDATLVAQVDSFEGPEISVDTEDATTHDSADYFEEVIATIIRTGELSFEILYDPGDTSHIALINQLKSRELAAFEFRFPDLDMTAWTFDALVKSFKPANPHNGKLAASVSIKPSGPMTFNSTYSV